MFKIQLLKQALLTSKEVIQKRDKTGHEVFVLAKDPLPALKDINPSIGEIEQFLTMFEVCDNGHRFDHIIL
jgi:hypothetical protein